MDRALRAPTVADFSPPRQRDLSFPVLLAMAAVALNLTLSANALFALGIPYAAPGGSMLVKLHPGTYLAIAAFFLSFRPATAGAAGPLFFAAMMLLCVVYTALTTGTDHAVVFLESFLPAGLLAVVLGQATAKARRLVGALILALVVVNAVICVVEVLVQRHLVPLVVLDQALVELPGEFRGTALYDHPLTGATVTMIGIFLLLGLRPKPAVTAILLPILMVGLLGFGGRAALGVTVLFLVVWGAAALLRRALDRSLRRVHAVLVLGSVLLLPALTAVLLAKTSIGERIVLRFYWDSSAQARSVQWHVLGLLSPRQVLFGMDYAGIGQLVAQLGLRFEITDIENFWLLMFLHVGAVGYGLFLAGFLALLMGQWRRAPLAGRLMLLAVLAVASSSNSLARKSAILTILIP
ncbi:MAG: VpsF family polysaccharide biosynthesis protein, partial [Acidisphaera sp.]|nr:VpsF family polysaccharide biosynthesis protein [Acidisphaera sp.]